MPSKNPEVPLGEIRDNIRLALSFVDGFNLRRFRADTRTVYAVTRCLEIISEASRRLPTNLKTRHPDISWKDIAGAGNVYRHDYEQISTDMIWNTIKALPGLLEVVEQELLRAKTKPAKQSR
jgi:uncharacterized protein with HEPN domain